MSESEFENYLAILNGMLRLNAGQRGEISAELRDHLEERLSELLDAGIDRDKAIEIALAEFGDAAGLAAHFVQISRNQRRRWVMRVTLGTVGVCLLLVFGLMAFWPGADSVPAFRTAVAQDLAAVPDDAGGAIQPSVEDNNALTEKNLSRRLEADFFEQALLDVLMELATRGDFQVYVNHAQLEDIGISTDAPVTVRLGSVRVDMLLDLILEQLGLAYIVRDGIVIVTSQDDVDQTQEVRVYNCRDLLQVARRPGRGYGAYGSAGMGGMDGGGMSGMGMGMGGMAMEDESDGMMGGASHPRTMSAQLINIITTSVVPDSWEVVGGSATVGEFQGLLVVKQDPRTHRQIERVLEMLREAAKKEPGSMVRVR